MNKKVIYILTNPSFPQFVKIGYADDVIDRVDRLNSNPGLPYSFRIYATYEVNERLDDLKLHKMIDALNPTLRTREEVDGKQRKREFFAMSAEVAYNIFEAMAEISGTRNRLHLWKADAKQKAEEEDAEEVRELNVNRHRFKEITFSSSLTGKTYYSKTNPDGSLGIFKKETNKEVVSFSNPSKKQIVRTALIDLGIEGDNSKTLYQLMHQLEKSVLSKNKKVEEVSETTEKPKEEIVTIDKDHCPRCGGLLVKRHGPYGNFYGCENFPINNCRYTRKFK